MNPAASNQASSANLNTAVRTTSGREETDPIVQGCRRLAARQKPGQCFSFREIGRECGTTGRAIEFVARRAQVKFAKRLHATSPGLLEDLFKDIPFREVLQKMNPSPYVTGNPRNKKLSDPGPKREVPKDTCGISLTKVARVLDSRNSKKHWRSHSSKQAA